MALRLAKYAASLITEKGDPDFSAISQQLLQTANSHTPVAEFLGEISRLIFLSTSCDALELWVKRQERCLCCLVSTSNAERLNIQNKRNKSNKTEISLTCMRDISLFDRLNRLVTEKVKHAKNAESPPQVGHWTGDFHQLLHGLANTDSAFANEMGKRVKGFKTFVTMPLQMTGETIGLLLLKCRQSNCFSEQEVKSYQMLAQPLALALVGQSAHAALHERVKELTCLYDLAQLSEHPSLTVETILGEIVKLLPTAWQYPEIATARIVMDGCTYATATFREGTQRQSAEIQIGGQCRGTLDVFYLEARPEIDEGPFLKEERSLIEAVARQVALIVERRSAAEEKLRLQDQLRHADRLATIGQLAAGVAHELNEPLGTILAFAQLAEKQVDTPKQTMGDLGKIVKASLHAREIIKKLMLFARQMPPQKTLVDLNAVIEDGLVFLESRCAKCGIRVQRRLSRHLPPITADPSQLNQVFVNLLVNAIQAMPEGGTLKIATRVTRQRIVLVVEDEGIGMSEEVLEKIFVPFFTTKDVHEGTGLGLPVVHGIVTAHGGTIAVKSSPGQGARFEVYLPLGNSQIEEESSSHGVEE